MLQPKRVKYRRPQDGRGNKGNAHRGTQLAFGSFGIKTLDAKWIDSRQIEAARVAINRYMNREGNTLYFKQDTSRGYRCYPSCGVTLTLTHSHVSRLASDGFVREDANPYLTFTVHITVDGNTGCLNLAAVDPLGVHSLDAEGAESQRCTSVGVAFVAASVLRSSISYSFWL